jgi:hypothetical protein
MDTESVESVRADLEAALDDVVALRGPTSPTAQILAHALLRGDQKTMTAALAMCQSSGHSVRLRHT